jgi:hypothetical protein
MEYFSKNTMLICKFLIYIYKIKIIYILILNLIKFFNQSKSKKNYTKIIQKIQIFKPKLTKK